MMEWQQIIGFYHVARLGSFTRAGEVTLRTQSALSQQIKSLEDEFGCQFFERIGTRKLKLTRAGERFLKFSESVLKGYEDLAGDLSELKGAQRGPLKIAAPFTTLYHLFPGNLKAYLERFPQVELTLLDRPQGKVVGLVRDGEVDFGLALESIVPKDLVFIRWKRVETVLMVPQGHALVQVRRITWRQLAKYPLIVPPRDLKHTGRIALEEHFQKLGLTYRIAMESSNVELSSLYVETGLGISLATVVRDLPVLKQRKLEFLGLDHYFKPDHLALVMRKDKVVVSYEKAFVNTLFGEPALADS
jgi:DNA-binding transcriptional LysR family regulator